MGLLHPVLPVGSKSFGRSDCKERKTRGNREKAKGKEGKKIMGKKDSLRRDSEKVKHRSWQQRDRRMMEF